MKNNFEKIRDLEEYLEKTEKSKKLNKLSDKLKVLINYYNGVKNKDNAEQYNISIRTISRLAKKYEEKGMEIFIISNYTGRKPKLSEKDKVKIKKVLLMNPLKLGLAYSIWNGNLLKRYIYDKFNIEVSRVFCEKVLAESDTDYKSQNYNTIKNKELNKIMKEIIEEYENNDKYSVWYFDTYYLGRKIIKEIMLKPSKQDKQKLNNIDYRDNNKVNNTKVDDIELSNDICEYMEYYVFGFFNKDGFLEYDIENKLDKKTFIKSITNFIDNIIGNTDDEINLLLVLDSDNIFKSITTIDKFCNSKQIKILYLPKNNKNLNKINYIWNKLDENKFDTNGIKHAEIKDKFKSHINKVPF